MKLTFYIILCMHVTTYVRMLYWTGDNIIAIYTLCTWSYVISYLNLDCMIPLLLEGLYIHEYKWQTPWPHVSISISHVKVNIMNKVSVSASVLNYVYWCITNIYAYIHTCILYIHIIVTIWVYTSRVYVHFQFLHTVWDEF